MSSSNFIPDDDTLISRIVSAVSITEYIGQSVKLKSSPSSEKGESTGCCPFHNDTNPSFGVSEVKGVFLCRGCGKSGNVVHFRSLTEGRDYNQVKKDFAIELGLIKNEELSAPLKLLEYTSRKYHEALLTRETSMSYLASRGLTKETIEKFRIGYCYGNEFERAGAERKSNAQDAGILTVSKKEEGRLYNQMSGRTTFPIRNKDGVVVGFGGRRAEGRDGPKYLNTGETSYFKKSDELYGLYEARNGISKEKHAIVVEGYLDVVVLHQESITNAVAVMGASTGAKRFASLWNVTKSIVFCLDPDKAGRDGTLRSVYQAAGEMKDDCIIQIAQLPGDLDPDEFVLKYGADQFKEHIKNATPLSIWLCEMVLEQEESKQGALGLHVAEHRTQFLSAVESVAVRFQNAPALQLEIQRQAHAILNAFVIDAALKKHDIQATQEEIIAALEMMRAVENHRVKKNSLS